MNITKYMFMIRDLISNNKYLSAGFVLIIFFILAKFVILIMEKIFMKLALKTETKLDDNLIKIVNKPISLIILLFGFKIFFIRIWKNMFFEFSSKF